MSVVPCWRESHSRLWCKATKKHSSCTHSKNFCTTQIRRPSLFDYPVQHSCSCYACTTAIVRANIHVCIEIATLEQNSTLTLRTPSCSITSIQAFSTSVDIQRFAPLWGLYIGYSLVRCHKIAWSRCCSWFVSSRKKKYNFLSIGFEPRQQPRGIRHNHCHFLQWMIIFETIRGTEREFYMLHIYPWRFILTLLRTFVIFFPTFVGSLSACIDYNWWCAENPPR